MNIIRLNSHWKCINEYIIPVSETLIQPLIFKHNKLSFMILSSSNALSLIDGHPTNAMSEMFLQPSAKPHTHIVTIIVI